MAFAQGAVRPYTVRLNRVEEAAEKACGGLT